MNITTDNVEVAMIAAASSIADSFAGYQRADEFNKAYVAIRKVVLEQRVDTGKVADALKDESAD